MGDEANTNESTVPNPDGPDDLRELEQLIAADEAEAAANRERGRERSNGSANEGRRAGQRLTPEVVSAKDAQRAGTGTAAGQPAAAPEPGKAGTATDAKGKKDDTGAEPGAAGGESGKAGKGESGQDDATLTPYQKAKRRESEAWKKINESKEELRLKEETLAARERQLAQARQDRADRRERRPAEGEYTREQYQSYAARWEANALRYEAEARRLEAAGDYDEADRQQAAAQKDRALAAAARQKASEMPAGRAGSQAAGEPGSAAGGAANGHGDPETEQRRAWAAVKADVPESLVAGSPLNAALIEFIQKNGQVLDTPDGVYRAVIQTGRQMVSKLEREAARVPELTAANTALTEKIKGLESELQRLTSLPGGEALNRGASAAKAFGDMPAKEREAILEAELAEHR